MTQGGRRREKTKQQAHASRPESRRQGHPPRKKERGVANPLRAARRQVCGGGTGGGTTEDVAGTLMGSRWVRIGANKGVKDIFGELAGKGLHPLPPPPKKKTPAEEGNDTAWQFPACNQARLISVFYLMAKVWEGGAGVGGGGPREAGRCKEMSLRLSEQRLSVQRV